MQWLVLLTALALPVIFGAACVSVAVKAGTPGRVAVVWGNGVLLGLFSTTLALRLLDFFELPFSVAMVSAVLGLLLCVVLFIGKSGFGGSGPRVDRDTAYDTLSATGKLLIVLFALLIFTRLLSLGFELLWRPLYAWDATMHWATKARVWFDTAQIAPFVDNQQWLELAGQGVFTDHHAGYPFTLPLLQAWVATALGYWDESLVNLPWLMCLVGLGALFYGQGRAAGAQPDVTLGFTYLLLSMPLLNTHVALAGYADLFQGAFYCAALAAFYNWSCSRRAGQALVAIAFAACCPFIKNEGFFWLLTFLPGLLLVLLPTRRALLLLVGAGLGGVVLLLIFPQDLVVAGHSLAELKLGYRPGMLAQIGRSLFVFDNWHLVGYLLLALVPMSLCLQRSVQLRLLPIAVVLMSAVILFLVLHVGTRFSYGALHFSSLGRISLQLLPALLFFALLVFDALWRDGISPQVRPERSADEDTR